jgi:branched-chain amino acid transport system permease protein
MLQQLVNGIALGSVYALIALGYTMVYGVLRLINFAHGDIYMLGAFVAYYLAILFGASQGAGLPVAVAIFVLSMAACALAGVFIERFAYRPLRSLPRLNSLITAIGVSLLLEFGGQMVFGPDFKPFPPILRERTVLAITPAPPAGSEAPSAAPEHGHSQQWTVRSGDRQIGTFRANGNWGLVVSSIQVTILVVSLVLMASLTWIVKRTKIGRAMRAISYDVRAAALMGVTTDKVIAFTFAIGSALAAAAGILDAAYKPTINPLMGVLPGLKAFVAAVLGGIGNIPGAMLGGMLMGLAETAVVAAGKSTYRDAIAFGILIVILLIRPRGLLGAVTEEKV